MGQDQVRFVHFSHKDIIGYINRLKPIDTQISLSGKAVQENFNYKRVILGRVSVREIYKLMEQYGERLLEKNIRRYLGKNAVNDGISETLQDDGKRQNFFFFNNGVTMICEKFSYNALQEENWIVKISGLQIINGGQTCRTIYQTLKECPDADFSQTYLLVRLYEVNEDIIQDITLAANSQNPVDFRDLKSNEEKQVLLEESAKNLGYEYKRKRDHVLNANVIPSTVAAEAVFAVWRGKPHLAKYRRNEFFDQYYNEIFDGLNAAQMLMAVFIFRYCDSRRKQIHTDSEIQAHRPYSQYFLAYMMGKQILQQEGIELKELTHVNFAEIRQFFQQQKQYIYEKAERMLTGLLEEYFNHALISEIDGRTIAAVFRRFDVLERFLKNKEWWNKHIL